MVIDSFKGDHSFLSNFAPAYVSYEGMTFRTVEHAYQAAKTLDWNEREHILRLLTAGAAKRAGRLVSLRADWEIIKRPVMHLLLTEKFKTEPYRTKLLATANDELIEGNRWGDTYWGVCRGIGENHLGILLMNVRASIRESMLR